MLIEIFLQKKASTVISVVKAEHPPTWYKKISPEGVILDYLNTIIDNSLNRQEADPTYLPNGAIYIFNYQELKNNYSYYNSRTYAYVMEAENSLDIDTPIDFELAKILIRNK